MIGEAWYDQRIMSRFLPGCISRATVALSLAALALALAGCGGATPEAGGASASGTGYDLTAHVPPFARMPYEPFARADAVAIALGEWRAFGSPVDDGTPRSYPTGEMKPERLPGQWERVGLYWWLGQDADRPEAAWTGKHDENGTVFPARDDGNFAWSAAFISFVMRMAGAGPRFPYSQAHATYINAAARQAQGIQRGWAITAMPADSYAPQVGDLICTGRSGANGIRFSQLPTPRSFPGHCDIVVQTGGGSLASIGGNVHDAVTEHLIPVTAQGTLAPPGGPALDPNHNWFVVLQVAYDR